jgi:hypothetical protein
MRYIPALELGVVTLANANPGGYQAGELLFWEILENLMGVERKERFDFNKENLFREKMGANSMRGKRDSLFGELASKGAEMIAGLEAHEGVFENPAYSRMTVSVAQRCKKDGEVSACDAVASRLGLRGGACAYSRRDLHGGDYRPVP